jgi:hypothetical protein
MIEMANETNNSQLIVQARIPGQPDWRNVTHVMFDCYSNASTERAQREAEIILQRWQMQPMFQGHEMRVYNDSKAILEVFAGKASRRLR